MPVEGLTLTELQEIGREVGISPDLVREAAILPRIFSTAIPNPRSSLSWPGNASSSKSTGKPFDIPAGTLSTAAPD